MINKIKGLVAFAAVAFAGAMAWGEEGATTPTQVADWFEASFDATTVDANWSTLPEGAELKEDKLFLDLDDDAEVSYTPSSMSKDGCKVTVNTKVTLNALDELPKVPTGSRPALTAFVLVGDWFYGVTTENGAQSWAKLTERSLTDLSGLNEGDECVVTAVIDFENGTATYSVNGTAVGSVAVTPSTSGSVSRVSYRGYGEVSRLEGDYLDADRKFAVANAAGGYDYYATEADAQDAAGEGKAYLALNGNGTWDEKTAPVWVAKIGDQGYETIQAAVNAADVSAGPVTIKVMAGTHNETVNLTSKTFSENDKTYSGRITLEAAEDAEVTLIGSVCANCGNISDVKIKGLTIAPTQAVYGSYAGVYLDCTAGDARNIEVSGCEITASNFAVYIGNTTGSNIVIKDCIFHDTSWGINVAGRTTTGIEISGTTFNNGLGIGLYGRVENVVVRGNTFVGARYNLYVSDEVGALDAPISVSGNAFIGKSPITMNGGYLYSEDFALGDGNTYGGETISSWADPADHEVMIDVNADTTDGYYTSVYHANKLYLGGETLFKSLDEAVAADESGDPLTIANYDSSMKAPEGWEFKSEGGVTKLVKTASAVAEVFASDGTLVKKCATLAEAFETAAVQTGTAENPVVIQLMAGTIEEGTVKLPTTFKNVKMVGAANKATTIKNTRIMAHDGGPWDYQDLTFEGVVYDNSQFVFTGWRAGATCTAKNWAFIGNEFKNIVNNPASNIAALHLNFAENESLVNLTFENNVINGVRGIQCSGIYGYVSGNIVIRNNRIENCDYRAMNMMPATKDGIDDNVIIEDNVFRGNYYEVMFMGSGADSTDNVSWTVCYNIFDDDETADTLDLYNTNPAKTTYVLDHNYYVKNPDEYPGKFYLNGACTKDNIASFGVYPYYAAYHKDELLAGKMTVRESLYDLVEPPVKDVCQIGDVKYPSIAAAVEAAPAGVETTITVIEDHMIVLETDKKCAVEILAGKKIVLDLNGKTITGAAYDSGNTSTALIKNKGKLTITDSAEKINGHFVGAIKHGANPTWVDDGSGSYASSYASNLISNEAGELIVNGGRLENVSTGSAAAVIDNYNSSGNVNLVVNDGELVAAAGSCIRLFGSGNANNDATINGGYFQALYYALRLQTGSSPSHVVINGGEFYATDKTWNCGISVKADVTDATVVEVKNGRFNGHVSGKSAKMSLTGGIYAYDRYEDSPSPVEMLSSLVAAGYELVNNPDDATSVTYPWAVQEKVEEEEIDVPTDDSGEAVIPVKVPEAVFEQKGEQKIVGKDGQPLPVPETKEEKQQFLATEQPNGLKVWQNVAMGVNGNTAENALATTSREPTDAEKAAATAAGKTIDIVINTPISDFTPPTTTGVTVSYRMLRSTNGGVNWTAVKGEDGRVLELEKPEFPAWTEDDTLISAGDTFWKFQAVFTSQAN